MPAWKKMYGSKVSFVCPYCLKRYPLLEATRDHIIPKSRGGSDDATNIVLCDKKCNNEKGALTAEEYKKWKKARNYLEWATLEDIRNGR